MDNSKSFLFNVIPYCLIIILLNCQFIYTQWVIDDEGCITPNGNSGSCVNIYACGNIINYMKTIKTLTPEISNSLFKYYCGVDRDTVKVCCSDEPITLPKTNNNDNLEMSQKEKDYKMKLLPKKCGMVRSLDYIVGGTKTSIFDFPWMTLLGYTEGNNIKYKCAGTIINNNYILTAAHCLQELPVTIRVGEHNIDTPEDCEKGFASIQSTKVCAPPVQDIEIAEIIPHPKFSVTARNNDIGLIRLASPINTTLETVKPICLPFSKESRSRNYIDDKFIVTGWGITERKLPSPEKLRVDLPILAIENCTTAYRLLALDINANQQFCVGGQLKKDSCNGDSGGPLQNVVGYVDDIRFTQYGIVSFGPRSCGQGLPAVYTRVDYYLDWILATIRP